jgi:hypothetical protein
LERVMHSHLSNPPINEICPKAFDSTQIAMNKKKLYIKVGLGLVDIRMISLLYLFVSESTR